MHTRIIWFAAAITALGCSRSFIVPGPPTPQVSGLSLASGAPLASSAPVAEGQMVLASGADLAGVTSILVGGVMVAPGMVQSGRVAFTIPPLSELGAQGQAQSIILVSAQGQTPAGELRVYGAPLLTSVAPGPNATGVIAGGQAYLDGSGFSSQIAENVVTIGGTAAEVVLAFPTQLLVSVPPNAPNGEPAFLVQIAPAGGDPAQFASLVSGVNAVVWKPLAPFLPVPPQALVGGTVRLMAPQPGFYSSYDDPTLRYASPAFASTVGGSATNGNSPQTSSASGSSGSSSNLIGNSTQTGGGFGVTVDGGAVAVNDPYPSSQSTTGGGDSRLVSPDAPSIQVGLANPKMYVDLDAVDTQVVPWERAEDASLLVTVPTDAPGSYSLAIGDPSGPSQSSSLQVLAGHLTSPAMTCRPPDNNLPGTGLLPRALRSTQLEGDVIVYQAGPQAGVPVSYAPVHPGGSLGPAWSLPYDGASTVVAAGRGTLFVEVQDSTGGSFLHASPLDAPLVDICTSVPSPASGALEPDFDAPTPWILLGGDHLAGQRVSAVPWLQDGGAASTGYDLSSLITDPSCTPLHAALEKVPRIAAASSGLERATLAYSCDGGIEVAVSQLLAAVPPTSGLTPATFDSITLPLGAAGSDGGILSASVVRLDTSGLGLGASVTIRQGLALAYGNGAMALDANAGTTGQPEWDTYAPGTPFAADMTIAAGALAPDGLQAALSGVRRSDGEEVVRLYDRQIPSDGSTPSWELQGELVLPPGPAPIAVEYDASGSQVVVLVQTTAADAGLLSGYCELH